MKTVFLSLITMALANIFIPCSSIAGIFQDLKEYNWERSANKVHYFIEKVEYPAARKQAEKSLRMAKEIFGPEHQNTATSWRNLAKVLFYEKEYDKAELFFNNALSIEKHSYAPTIEDLADLYAIQKKYDKALNYYEEALSVNEQHYGKSDKIFLPNILKKMIPIYKELNRSDDAERIMNRLQEIQR